MKLEGVQGSLGEAVLSLLPCSELWGTRCCTPALSPSLWLRAEVPEPLSKRHPDALFLAPPEKQSSGETSRALCLCPAMQAAGTAARSLLLLH